MPERTALTGDAPAAPPLLTPPYTAPSRFAAAIGAVGHAVLSPEGLRELLRLDAEALRSLEPSWDDLVPDAYLRDGGRYRKRRYACFTVEGDEVVQTPHRAHWQPLHYNALHGGLERWFEPIQAQVLALPAWAALLRWLGSVCTEVVAPAAPRWYVECHQFRIDTTDGIGRPTPEGAHRDGVDFVAVVLVGRRNVKGGETRVFEAAGPNGIRFTLSEPWTLMMLDDARVIHESTPIQPLAESDGCRDTLVLTFRRGGFQGP